MSGNFKRILGRRDVLALAFGAMIGWSWVAVAGDWIARGGTIGAILAFIGGGLAITLIGLTYAELASAMPQAGGEHVYTKRALGRGWSFICTWAIIFAYVGVAAFESIAVAMIAEYFYPAVKSGYLWTIAGHDVHAGSVAIGVGATLVITLLNIMGVKQAAIFQLIATITIFAGGLVLFAGSSISGSPANFSPLFTNGLAGIAGVLVMVPSMMVGFDVIPQSAEEIDLPFEDIGKVLMLALGMAVLWYVLIIVGVSLALDEGERAAATLTTAAASQKVWSSPIAGHLLVIAGLGGVLTSWNAFVIGGSRAIYALSRAGQLPAIFGELHPKTR
ncbi:MAG: amino acid permease, partial [Sphingomonadales bacterium]|nr:amino acid permease [Sphingomonadales bacterium]